MPVVRPPIVIVLMRLVLAMPVEAAWPLVPLRTATPPVIDGDLGDPVWQVAPTVSGFKTWFPDYGEVMPDDTVVYRSLSMTRASTQ